MSRRDDIEIQEEEKDLEAQMVMAPATRDTIRPRQDEVGTHNQIYSSRPPVEESHRQLQDFDDSANELWSLYGKQAKSHDEAWAMEIKADMDGVLIFAGLFSVVIAAFVVPKIRDLNVNPADQSVYYQNQTVQLLDRISRQVDGQNSTNYTPPLPYPTSDPSGSNRRAIILWLISLVCSLSAALLATLVQQWVRAYMRIFQQSRDPLNAARVRLFLFEGAKRFPSIAESVPGLIHISLLLFFTGLSDITFQIDAVVFITTVVPIVACLTLYLICTIAPILNPQLPYRTPLSDLILRLIRRLHHSCHYLRGKHVRAAGMEVRQEVFAMEPTKDRMDRDVRALQWLVKNINDGDEMETLVLAIPGSFNQWGQDVWNVVLRDGQPHPGLPSVHKRTTVDRLCKYVRSVLENERDYADTKIQRRRMRRYIEATAILVCVTNVELGFFGDITGVLSEVGNNEQTNNSLTIRSNPLFAVRWTCLSLVAIWQKFDANRLQEVAKFALDGYQRIQTNYGPVDTNGLLTAAQRMDDWLNKAWAAVLDLRLALEPWGLDQNRAESDIRDILINCQKSVLDLERIAIEATVVEEIDWRIRFLQERMDEATHELVRRLPGVFFDKLHPTASSKTSDAFDLPSINTTPIPPQFVFPGQQLQSLGILGRRLRDITDGRNVEFHEETVKRLREIPTPLCGFDHMMKRQIWRLLDLRDGRGLGFAIELFFLALRQFSLTSSELDNVLCAGTFKAITSNWKESKDSTGTQLILVNLLCDLVIQGRGIFSDLSYPPYIVEMLLELVGNIAEGHGVSHPHILDIMQELEYDNIRHHVDYELHARVLRVIHRFVAPS